MGGSICAVLWTVALIQTEQPSPDGPRALYRQAAASIAEGNASAAIAPLEKLRDQHPNSPLADQSALALAECYLSDHRYAQTLKWLSQLADETLTEEAQKRIRDLQQEATRRAANASERHGDYLQALQWIERGLRFAAEEGDHGTGDELSREYVRMGLAACLQNFDNSGDAEDVLQRIKEDRRPAIRFALAESLYLRADYDSALEHFDVLARSDALSPRSESEPVDLPDWAAGVALRLGEIYLRKRQYHRADDLLQVARERFAESENAVAFDFLLARSAIAQIEFERAIACLQKILAYPVRTLSERDAEQRARAQWMIGEVFFLQKRYSEAIAAYRLVPEYASAVWTPRSLLQQAKCEELTGQIDNALATYKDLERQFEESNEAAFARQRMAYLATATKRNH